MTIQGRWAWAVLIVMFLSLGANFFVLGFLANRGPLTRGGFRGGPPALAGLLEDFPPEMRRSIGRQLWQERGQFRSTADAIREKRFEIAEAFRAPDVDLPHVRNLMKDVRDLTATLQENAQEALITSVSALPPEERTRIRASHGGHSPWR